MLSLKKASVFIVKTDIPATDNLKKLPRNKKKTLTDRN